MRLDELIDRCFQFIYRSKYATSDLLVRNQAKEPLDKIQPRRTSWDEMQMHMLVSFKPISDFLVLVRGVLVHNGMKIVPSRGMLFHDLQKGKKLTVPMFRLAFANHLTCCHLQRRKQHARAMPFVVMGHRFTSSRLHR